MPIHLNGQNFQLQTPNVRNYGVASAAADLYGLWDSLPQSWKDEIFKPKSQENANRSGIPSTNTTSEQPTKSDEAPDLGMNIAYPDDGSGSGNTTLGTILSGETSNGDMPSDTASNRTPQIFQKPLYIFKNPNNPTLSWETGEDSNANFKSAQSGTNVGVVGQKSNNVVQSQQANSVQPTTDGSQASWLDTDDAEYQTPAIPATRRWRDKLQNSWLIPNRPYTNLVLQAAQIERDPPIPNQGMSSYERTKTKGIIAAQWNQLQYRIEKGRYSGNDPRVQAAAKQLLDAYSKVGDPTDLAPIPPMAGGFNSVPKNSVTKYVQQQTSAQDVVDILNKINSQGELTPSDQVSLDTELNRIIGDINGSVGTLADAERVREQFLVTGSETQKNIRDVIQKYFNSIASIGQAALKSAWAENLNAKSKDALEQFSKPANANDITDPKSYAAQLLGASTTTLGNPVTAIAGLFGSDLPALSQDFKPAFDGNVEQFKQFWQSVMMSADVDRKLIGDLAKESYRKAGKNYNNLAALYEFNKSLPTELEVPEALPVKNYSKNLMDVPVNFVFAETTPGQKLNNSEDTNRTDILPPKVEQPKKPKDPKKPKEPIKPNVPSEAPVEAPHRLRR